MVYQSSDRHWTAERLGNKKVELRTGVGYLHRNPASFVHWVKADPEWLHQQTIRVLAG